MKKVNNYWIDDKNNKWSVNLNTEKQAVIKSKTLMNCHDCSNCSDCSNCYYCSNCHDCSNCSDCSDCSDFKENPQRIVSPKLGSRNSQTIIYWVNNKTLVICGCYKDNLNNFKKRVDEIYGKGQPYGEEYRNWIKRVENYINN